MLHTKRQKNRAKGKSSAKSSPHERKDGGRVGTGRSGEDLPQNWRKPRRIGIERVCKWIRY